MKRMVTPLGFLQVARERRRNNFKYFVLKKTPGTDTELRPHCVSSEIPGFTLRVSQNASYTFSTIKRSMAVIMVIGCIQLELTELHAC